MTTSPPALRSTPTARRLVALACLHGLWLAIASGCGRTVKPDEPPAKPEVVVTARGLFTDATDQLRGLSDLSRDADGQLWAIPERQDLLARALLGAGTLSWATLPLQGKPTDCDGEALAWIAPGQFAIGTERHQDARQTDLVLLGHLTADAAIIDQQVAMPYALWGMTADDNKGIEGLCAAGGLLLAGVEHVISERGQRFAPLGVYDLTAKRWRGLRLRLTSTTGKLSALACTAQPNGALALWAIERHYGIARWLRAELPVGATGDLTAVVHADLATAVHAALGGVPNFEGIAGDPSDPQAAWLIADNDSGGHAVGPNRIVRLGLATATGR